MDLLVHLRGFVAVADELSVSRAAESLGVDQPLLSRRVRALERHLDVGLLDRSRRQITLTPDGTALLPRARHLLEQAEHLERTVGPVEAAPVVLTVPEAVLSRPLAGLARLLDELGVEWELAAPGTEPDPAGWRVEPVVVAEPSWTTPLGVATPRPARHAVVHLVDLRVRRGGRAPALLATDTDAGSPWWPTVTDALDRAGIPAAHVPVLPRSHALARALAGGPGVLLGRAEALEAGLSWVPLAEGVGRAHRLVEAGPLPAALRTGAARDRALALLREAVGS